MKVRGKNVVVLISDGDSYIPWVCALSVDFTLTTEFIETSESGNGSFASFEPTKHSYVGSMNGITSLNNPGSFTLPDLRAKQVAKEKLLMRYQLTDDGGNVYTEQAFFYIASSLYTGSFDGMNTFSIGLQGTGAITPFSLNTDDMDYLIYAAEMSQSGTDAPVATIIKNTLGDIVWTYGGVGVYNGDLVGAFPAGKTFIPNLPFFDSALFPVSGTSNFQLVTLTRQSADQVRLYTKQGTSGALSGTDGILLVFKIEIRVYT